MDPLQIIETYYPDDTPLRRLLLEHSRRVREEALRIAATPACAGMALDPAILSAGAWLHDIGILHCHAPSIYCTGREPYLRHGLLGARMLRAWGAAHGTDMEPFARICERHTGSGLTAEEIRARALPLPPRDWLPETPEEKLLCLADKFHSKSAPGQRRTLEQVRQSAARFGPAPLARLETLLTAFGLA